MPIKQISFHDTRQEFDARRQTVTRRLGYETVYLAELMMAIDRDVKLGKIRVRTIRREPLNKILDYPIEEVVNSGYPGWSAMKFLNYFCQKRKCEAETMITRIEFEYEKP